MTNKTTDDKRPLSTKEKDALKFLAYIQDKLEKLSKEKKT